MRQLQNSQTVKIGSWLVTTPEEFNWNRHIIKVFERLEHMHEISEKHCDVNKLIIVIDKQCSKVGCNYFKLLLRRESYIFELFGLYQVIIRLINTFIRILKKPK